MLAKLFHTKYLKKCYNDTNSQEKRRERPKKIYFNVSQIGLLQRWSETSWSNYSTTDHIHVINQVVEIYAEYIKPQCMNDYHTCG